ncbi:phospholipase A1 2-like [Eupeodes corollae]|uniref:phospholipase A1 2-like n=1 Tax=Eupeodes corollae TaxID=290404 RepID=UPI00248F71C0|nr:phospholipase A1 2-like [Eupeodes corollae]
MKKYAIFVVAVFVLIARSKAFPAESNGSIKETSSEEPDRVHFYLYTQPNFSEPYDIDMNDVETLARSPFDFRNPTTFMIHGWNDVYTSGATGSIREALSKTDQSKKPNFISVDWRIYSKFENYTKSQQLCSTAGKEVAKFIDWMHENSKLRFDTLTLYGHSMGAQVAGFVGKNVQRGKVHTILGMDPAFPIFESLGPEDRLAETDAEYVETMHTNGGQWGFYHPIGQTAFYPNGGKYQPGCGIDSDGMCSHQKAIYYLAEAIISGEKNEFHAVKCDELTQVEESKCNKYESIIRMADPRNAQKPRGIFYLETNSEAPYAKGIAALLEKKEGIKKHAQS